MQERTDVSLAMIVAMAENRVIGRDNQLPWHLPNDLKYFKAVTMGKPIIMGRKTFESIGKPLPGRSNIVVTRNPQFTAEGVRLAADVEQAVAIAQEIALAEGIDEVMVIGGGQLYAELLPMVRRLYVTRVHAQVEGDAFFPELDWAQWQLTDREQYAAEGSNPYEYSFNTYRRIQ